MHTHAHALTHSYTLMALLTCRKGEGKDDFNYAFSSRSGKRVQYILLSSISSPTSFIPNLSLYNKESEMHESQGVH